MNKKKSRINKEEYLITYLACITVNQEAISSQSFAIGCDHNLNPRSLKISEAGDQDDSLQCSRLYFSMSHLDHWI